MQDRLKIDASIGEANCLITEFKEGMFLSTYCKNIKKIKIEGFNK